MKKKSTKEKLSPAARKIQTQLATLYLRLAQIDDEDWGPKEKLNAMKEIESSPYLVASEIKEFHDKLSSCWNVVNSTPLKGWWSFPYFNRNCVGV